MAFGAINNWEDRIVSGFRFGLRGRGRGNEAALGSKIEEKKDEGVNA